MAEARETVTNELLLEHLKAIQGQLTHLQKDMVEVKERLGILEMQYASLSRRVDRLDERVERMERRLDLVEG
jgi:predicted  nucleic acid-binding Zn-ribbon protein